MCDRDRCHCHGNYYQCVFCSCTSTFDDLVQQRVLWLQPSEVPELGSSTALLSVAGRLFRHVALQHPRPACRAHKCLGQPVDGHPRGSCNELVSARVQPALMIRCAGQNPGSDAGHHRTIRCPICGLPWQPRKRIWAALLRQAVWTCQVHGKQLKQSRMTPDTSGMWTTKMVAMAASWPHYSVAKEKNCTLFVGDVVQVRTADMHLLLE